MKRKLFALFLSFAMVLGLCTNVSAHPVEEVQVLETATGALYRSSQGSVEYLKEINGYYLEGVTKDEFFEAMDRASEKAHSL